MSIVFTQRNARLQTVLNDLNARVGGIITAMQAAKARRAVYRRTFSELSRLSDRELSDLSIPRSHIRRIAVEESLKV